jgi:glycosyltransferase involved in cell wall biosynthesis
MMKYRKLSIIVPVYNELNSLETVVGRIKTQLLNNLGFKEIEVIIVDDGSTDGTKEWLKKLNNKYQLISHKQNRGLTGAMTSGLKRATGDVILVQHADLEYHPKDWPKLLRPIIAGTADMVMGSRYLRKFGKQHFSVRYQLGGQGLTRLFNLIYRTQFTDIFTAHRAFTKKVKDSFKPRGKGFAFETELTAQVTKRKWHIQEVPISYAARTFQEGKKLHWHAALEVIGAMVRNLRG